MGLGLGLGLRLVLGLGLGLGLGFRGHDLALLVGLAGEEVSQRRLEPVDILAVVRLHLRANEEAEMLTALGRTQGRVRVWANVLH